MIAFDRLGEAIEQRWRRANYDTAGFADVAAEALAEAKLPEEVAGADILRWILAADVLPAQHDVEGSFGDLSITLFKGSRFVIDAYYWLDGTTAIHQHAFVGAFQVLAGGSVHSRYDFREDHIVNDHFVVGALTLADVELLTRGEIRRILPGAAQIHSLFHLDRPSITITVRADVPEAGAQFDYLPPSLAIDTFYKNAEIAKKVRTAAVLLTTKQPEADAMIADAICAADFHTAYLILAEAFQHLKSSPLEALFDLSTGADRFAGLLERARRVHGGLVDVVRPVLDEQERQRGIIARRRSITGDAHRFLMALLLNIRDKARILTLVKRRLPDADPVDAVVGWIEELARISVFGSREPNVLNIEHFGPEHVRAIEQSLRGRPPEASAECLRALRSSPLGVLVG